jgi:type IV pilus assembly protein PilA
MTPKNSRRSGFTLIELLVVVVIIGILAALALPKVGATTQRGHRTSGISDLRNLQVRQETFFNDNSRYGSLADSAALQLRVSAANTGLTITLAGTPTGVGGWSGTLSIPGNEKCGVFVGTALRPVGMPVTTLPGSVTCW